jgi:putative transposase
MDDILMNGQKFWVLNVIDDFNHEALKIDPYFRISSQRLITILEWIIREKGKPFAIQ